MPDYRRWYVPGGTYYFTVVTDRRTPTFRNPDAAHLLGAAMREVRGKASFATIAVVLLWDHLHCTWTLPEGDDDYSARWRRIKASFTDKWLSAGGFEATRSPSRIAKGERGVWHRRFWEHVVRDEDDLERHVDYIHYNPVKHGYVSRPGDWPWSSFRRFVESGHYLVDWGRADPPVPPGRHPE
jgi:putative transposase